MKPGIPALLSAGLLLGCVPSVNPLHSPDVVIVLPKLVGSWCSQDGSEHWRFESRGDRSYALTLTGAGEKDDEASAEFIAHVVKLDDLIFLDTLLVRASGEFTGLGLARCSMIARPAHLIYRLVGPEPEFKLVPLNPDRLGEMIREDSLGLVHECLREPDADEERLILTATTKDLQRFFRKHGADPVLFDLSATEALRSAETKPAL